jgi:single-stranded-DNA-specific exonuclease
MAAIATIADAVPLKGENRVIALLVCASCAACRRRPARALCRRGPRSGRQAITGFDVAFRLAPRINAAGRMDVASEVIELFTTRDAARAAELAAKLERLNRERRETEAAALTAIETRLATDAELAADRLLVIDGDGWHRGVIGILASRVVERTAKPAIVVSIEDGVALTAPAARSTAFSCSTPSRAAPISYALRRPRLRGRLCPARRCAAGAEAPPAPLRRGTSGRPRAGAPAPHSRRAAAGPHHAGAGWLAAQAGALRPRQPRAGLCSPQVRLLAAPRMMKERHTRLELAQDSVQPRPLPGSSGALRAVGWDLAARAAELLASRREASSTSPTASAKTSTPSTAAWKPRSPESNLA